MIAGNAIVLQGDWDGMIMSKDESRDERWGEHHNGYVTKMMLQVVMKGEEKSLKRTPGKHWPGLLRSNMRDDPKGQVQEKSQRRVTNSRGVTG